MNKVMPRSNARVFAILMVSLSVLSLPSSALGAAEEGWTADGSLPRPLTATPGFGADVEMDGDRLVVGAPATVPASGGIGQAILFSDDGTEWGVTDEVSADALSIGEDFGGDVSMSGDLVAVASKSPTSGRAFVYRTSAVGLVLEDVLANPHPERGEVFGAGIAISGSVLAVTAPPSPTDALLGDVGSVYVFRSAAGAWQFEQRLVPQFVVGDDLAIDGDILAVALRDAGWMVFHRDVTGWAEEMALPPQVFGGVTDVDVDGDFVATAGYVSGFFGPERGVYVFKRGSCEWELEMERRGDVDAPDRVYGSAIAIDEGLVIVGAKGYLDTAVPGAAYTFTRVNGGWQPSTTLTAPLFSQSFGSAVTVSDGAAAVSAPREGETVVPDVHMFSHFGVAEPIPGRRESVRLEPEWGTPPMSRVFNSFEMGPSINTGPYLSFDGDDLAVSAYSHNDIVGRVYHRDSTGAWSDAELLRTTSETGGFLQPVMGDDIALIGDPGWNPPPEPPYSYGPVGRVLVLERGDGQWLPGAEIYPPNLTFPGFFGSSLAVHGETILVVGGNPADGSETSILYAYRRAPQGWDLASQTEIGPLFTMQLESDTVLFVREDYEEGTLRRSAEIFRMLENGTIVHEDSVPLPADEGGTALGDIELSPDGSRFIFAYEYAWFDFEGEEKAWIFERSADGSWGLAATLVHPDPGPIDQYDSVAIDGGVAVVGVTPRHGHRGAAFVFRETVNGTWQFFDELVSSEPRGWGRVGTETEVRGSTVVVGEAGVACGAVNIYELTDLPSRVRLDVRPGDDANVVNGSSRERVPFALLSEPGFNAPDSVVPSSLRLGRTGTETGVADCKKPVDVNGDGLQDLVCRVPGAKLGLLPGEGNLVLTGRLVSGKPIEGADRVHVQ